MNRVEALQALRELRDRMPLSKSAKELTAVLEAPIPMQLWCPMCGTRHIDEGEFATKPHHTHSCQNDHCGLTWRPAVEHTVGVFTLPGFLNQAPKSRAVRAAEAFGDMALQCFQAKLDYSQGRITEAHHAEAVRQYQLAQDELLAALRE